MKSLCFLFAFGGWAIAQESIERLDAKFDALIPRDVTVETLCTGFIWAEGPVWDAANDRLLFSDVRANTVYQWKEGDRNAEIYLKPAGYSGPNPEKLAECGANGLAFDAKGRLVSCEHGDRRVSYLTANGGKRTLTDQWNGKRFHSPNDLTITPNGDVYFTDPPYGLPSRSEKDPASEMDFCGVFRVTPAGETTLLTKEFTRPNGIALAPDGKSLFVGQSTSPAVIKRFPLAPDGSLGEGAVFFDFGKFENPRGVPDGFKIDPQGNVFSSGPDGVFVIAPDGQLLGRVHTGRGTANVGFGKGYLYITAQDRVLRVKLAH
ncbi:MAG TPA: SMP-30/gluconolactonase/LRE family protein [Luteolibacter sp.]